MSELHAVWDKYWLVPIPTPPFDNNNVIFKAHTPFDFDWGSAIGHVIVSQQVNIYSQ